MATFLQASYVWCFVMTKHAPIMSNCTKEVCMIPRESAVLCILHFKLALCVKSEPDLWVSLWASLTGWWTPACCSRVSGPALVQVFENVSRNVTIHKWSETKLISCNCCPG